MNVVLKSFMILCRLSLRKCVSILSRITFSSIRKSIFEKKFFF